MPMLTRRRAPDIEHTWLVHFGDIHIGTIAQRSGVPGMVDQWGWTIGFYPASHRGVRADCTAKTFDQARADFEVAWHRLQPELTS